MYFFTDVLWALLTVIVLGLLAYAVVAFTMLLTAVGSGYLQARSRVCYFNGRPRQLPSRQRKTSTGVMVGLGLTVLSTWAVLVYVVMIQ